MLPDAFGCVVANRFGDLLDDEADPFDLMKQVEKEKEKQRDKKKKKKKKKEGEEKNNKQKRPGQKESQKDRRVPRGFDGQEPVPVLKPGQTFPVGVSENKHGKEQDLGGMKKAAAGQRKAKNEENPLEYSIDKPSYNPDSFLEGRGGFRGRRGAKPGGFSRNPDNFNQRGKREFDRHTGTGISPEDKRGGRGPWNWGSVEDAASEVIEVTPDVSLKSDEPQVAAEESPKSNAEEDNGDVMVHVAVEMSLDEWKAMEEMKRSKSEFNIRKAEDQIPSKAKVIHQSKNMEILKTPMEDVEDEGNYLRKSVNDITTLLDINFGDLSRTGGRGGRGRGGRGGQILHPERLKSILEKDELAPNPDDPEDFPALSARK